jgi:hypothetical protein
MTLCNMARNHSNFVLLHGDIILHEGLYNIDFVDQNSTEPELRGILVNMDKVGSFPRTYCKCTTRQKLQTNCPGRK